MTMLPPRWLLTPETAWGAVVAAAAVLALANLMLDRRLSAPLLALVGWLPLLTIPPLFWLAWHPAASSGSSWGWLLFRVWIATGVGVNLAGLLLVMTVRTGGSGDAGVGAAPLLVAGYGFMVFVPCLLASLPLHAPRHWLPALVGLAAAAVWVRIVMLLLGIGALAGSGLLVLASLLLHGLWRLTLR